MKIEKGSRSSGWNLIARSKGRSHIKRENNTEDHIGWSVTVVEGTATSQGIALLGEMWKVTIFGKEDLINHLGLKVTILGK